MQVTRSMKSLIHFSVAAIVCAVVLALAGCKATPAALVGTYAIEEDGQQKVFLRIEKSSDKYLVYEKDGRKWLAPAEAEEIDDVDLERIAGQSIPERFVGIGNDTMAVLLVHKGWKLGNFESKTGFLLASQLGPMDLYKQ